MGRKTNKYISKIKNWWYRLLHYKEIKIWRNNTKYFTINDCTEEETRLIQKEENDEREMLKNANS